MMRYLLVLLSISIATAAPLPKGLNKPYNKLAPRPLNPVELNWLDWYVREDASGNTIRWRSDHDRSTQFFNRDDHFCDDPDCPTCFSYVYRTNSGLREVIDDGNGVKRVVYPPNDPSGP